jgi:malate dehydrogenase
MLRTVLRSAPQRAFSTGRGPKVAVVGAAGGIGQPLSLLLKQSPLVSKLSLYDLAPFTPGVGVDLSHINTPAQVTAYTGADNLAEALSGCDVIVVPAGVPRKEGMTRDDLFNINAGIVAGIAKTAAEVAPNAAMCIISNPVNSTVPIVAEIQKRLEAYNPKKLFGVTTLDVCRANTFVSENQGFEVGNTNVTVVGGHAGKTILPLLSQVQNGNFSQEDIEALTHRIMFGGDEVVKAKAGHGSATLSMAYAGAHFALQVIRAANGQEGIVECSYVDGGIVEGVDFFSSPVELGPEGVKTVHGTGEMSAYEQKLFAEMLPELKDSIAKGVEFAKKYEL